MYSRDRLCIYLNKDLGKLVLFSVDKNANYDKWWHWHRQSGHMTSIATRVPGSGSLMEQYTALVSFIVNYLGPPWSCLFNCEGLRGVVRCGGKRCVCLSGFVTMYVCMYVCMCVCVYVIVSCVCVFVCLCKHVNLCCGYLTMYCVCMCVCATLYVSV